MNNLVHSLEARYYLAPEVFSQEQLGMMSKTWQFACHESQVRQVGQYVSFEVAGQNLFCVRGKDHAVRVFYNVCQHRAHELVSGSGQTRLLVCPYHNWTYNLAGRLMGGPNLKSVPGLDISKICLTEVRVENFHGFIFINLDDHAAPMDEWFPNARQELQEYVPQIAELALLEWVTVEENCNWKLSVENYSECYHCRINHKTFSSGVIKPETYDIQPQGHCLRHTTECQNLDQMSYEINTESNLNAGKYSSWFLWPMFSFQVYPGNVLNTYHWRPLSVDTVEVWRGWFTVGGEESDTIRQLAIQDRETTVEEDIHLVESVQRGLNSKGYRPGPLVVDPNSGVNSEHSIKVLQGWMRQAVEYRGHKSKLQERSLLDGQGTI